MESHETIMSDSDASLAIKFELGFSKVNKVVVDQFALSKSLAVDTHNAKGDENNVIFEGVKLFNLLAKNP